jgi:multiple sugar transport system substrate-binding protein
MTTKKRTIMNLSLLVALILVISLFTGCGQQGTVTSATTAAPGELSGKVEMWGWSVEATKSFPYFKDKYPNIEMSCTNVVGSDYITKIQTSMAAGLPLCDILWCDLGVRGILFDMGILENLDAAPYNFDRSLVLDYTIPIITNEKGEVNCIPWDSGLACYALRMDVWDKYLGIKTVEEAEKKMADWDMFIQTGLELKTKSDGKAFMLPSLADAANTIFQQMGGIVEGGKVILDSRLKNLFNRVAQIRDAKVVDTVEPWSPPWWSSVSADIYLCQMMPFWRMVTIQTDAPKTNDGRWKVGTPPSGGFSMGGTAFGITKDSKVKDAAWAYIKWYLLSDIGAQVNKDTFKVYIHYKPAFNNPAYKMTKNEWFGDQDIGAKMFDDVVKTVPKLAISKYDRQINDVFGFVLTAMTADATVTGAAAYDMYKKEMANRYPDVPVEEK